MAACARVQSQYVCVGGWVGVILCLCPLVRSQAACEALSVSLYASDKHLLLELVQNADGELVHAACMPSQTVFACSLKPCMVGTRPGCRVCMTMACPLHSQTRFRHWPGHLLVGHPNAEMYDALYQRNITNSYSDIALLVLHTWCLPLSDCSYEAAQAAGQPATLSLLALPDGLVLGCNEDGFTEQNVRAICSLGKSSKALVEGDKNSTGESVDCMHASGEVCTMPFLQFP